MQIWRVSVKLSHASPVFGLFLIFSAGLGHHADSFWSLDNECDYVGRQLCTSTSA